VCVLHVCGVVFPKCVVWYVHVCVRAKSAVWYGSVGAARELVGVTVKVRDGVVRVAVGQFWSGG